LSDEDLTELLEQRLQSETHVVTLETLSDIINREAVTEIDLLKVDVEKSELEVLQGIEPRHWPLIRQVVIEVHDVSNRLDRVVQLLKSNGFIIEVEQDCLLETSGMFNVFARRPQYARLYGPGADKQSFSAVALRKKGWLGPETLKGELRRFLAEKLPDYMVPSSIILLDRLPTTPSGKLDRQALSRIMVGKLNDRAKFVPPRTNLEIQLATIWSEVLGIARVGISDNFFELGGHSLKATGRCADPRQISGGFSSSTNL